MKNINWRINQILQNKKVDEELIFKKEGTVKVIAVLKRFWKLKPGLKHTTLDHQDYSKEYFFNLLRFYLKDFGYWNLPKV